MRAAVARASSCQRDWRQLASAHRGLAERLDHRVAVGGGRVAIGQLRPADQLDPRGRRLEVVQLVLARAIAEELVFFAAQLTGHVPQGEDGAEDQLGVVFGFERSPRQRWNITIAQGVGGDIPLLEALGCCPALGVDTLGWVILALMRV